VSTREDVVKVVATLEFSNEFASVALSVERGLNGDRLRIADVRGGAAVYLDPVEVEGLTRSDRQQLRVLLDPTRVGDVGSEAGHE